MVFGTLEEKLCSRIHFFESVTFLEEILLKSYYFRSRFFEKKVIFFSKINAQFWLFGVSLGRIDEF